MLDQGAYNLYLLVTLSDNSFNDETGRISDLGISWKIKHDYFLGLLPAVLLIHGGSKKVYYVLNTMSTRS